MKIPLENRLSWGTTKNYAVIAYQMNPGLDFIKSIIDRAASPSKKSTELQKILAGSLDLTLFISLKKLSKFLKNSRLAMAALPISKKWKFFLDYFSYLLIKSENEIDKFYHYNVIIRK